MSISLSVEMDHLGEGILDRNGGPTLAILSNYPCFFLVLILLFLLVFEHVSLYDGVVGLGLVSGLRLSLICFNMVMFGALSFVGRVLFYTWSCLILLIFLFLRSLVSILNTGWCSLFHLSRFLSRSGGRRRWLRFCFLWDHFLNLRGLLVQCRLLVSYDIFIDRQIVLSKLLALVDLTVLVRVFLVLARAVVVDWKMCLV